MKSKVKSKRKHIHVNSSSSSSSRRKHITYPKNVKIPKEIRELFDMIEENHGFELDWDVSDYITDKEWDIDGLRDDIRVAIEKRKRKKKQPLSAAGTVSPFSSSSSSLLSSSSSSFVGSPLNAMR